MDDLKPDARRRALVAALGSALVGVGCSSSPTLRMMQEGVSPGAGAPTPEALRAELAKVDAPTMVVRIGRSVPGVVVLADAQNHELTWVAGNNQQIITRKGRIVRTAGFPRDLESTTGAEADLMPAIWSYPPHSVGISTFLMNFNKPRELQVPFHAAVRVLGWDPIEILGHSENALKIEEDVDVPSWRKSFKNVYWLDPKTGYVWRTRQQYCPEIPEIQLDLVRPPFPNLL